MKNVLIIDDSPQIRERIATLLAESPQIRIAGQAGSGHEAMAAVQKLHPDTVTLDIHLPDQSGIALLKVFKTHYPEMVVIMLTNFDDATYRRRCRHLGADHFLSKRLEFEKIVDTIIANPTH
ncbi:Response regulator receiver protein (fragment) [Desulfosarcina cetonica]|uniref:response regulator n=1 Tax=Desulfosarcina cetonica TaxID=90730 RepID=UPI0006D27962